jgi:pyruvate formate lyase activating enzyme
MKIAGYLKTSLIEWPGKISSVIFVPGCNFRCPFCHNRDLVEPQEIKKLPEIAEKEIFKNLKKRKKWIDGVVVTGGEPTLQPDLAQFLQKCQALGFKTMVETNGSQPAVIKKLILAKLVDYWRMDYKVPLGEYRKLTNLAKIAAKIAQSIKILAMSSADWELRTTIVPGIHDSKILLQMAKELKIGGKINWSLQNFQPKNCLDPKFNKIKPYSKIRLEELLKAVKKTVPEISLKLNE